MGVEVEKGVIGHWVERVVDDDWVVRGSTRLVKPWVLMMGRNRECCIDCNSSQFELLRNRDEHFPTMSPADMKLMTSLWIVPVVVVEQRC